MKGALVSAISGEISSQPECWRHAVELARGPLSAALPPPGERVAVVGCGTSYFMAQSFAALREQADVGLTDAFAASEMPGNRRYDRILVLTRSGTTTEVLDVVRRIDGMVPTVAITAVADTPVARAATDTIVLDFADERSVVQTRFATTTLALLRAHLGHDLDATIKDAANAVDAPLPTGALERTQFSFLGRGWTIGLAQEAALKVREASQSWSDAYPALEYRHGPISVADERSLVWLFGDLPTDLDADITATGAAFEHTFVDPMADLIRAQRLAVALAEQHGLDPDAPRHLTRSVILGQ
jgi:fructoselysine-6-P-deglycase FrlB-like protein